MGNATALIETDVLEDDVEQLKDPLLFVGWD
jgi:hypothetical protein